MTEENMFEDWDELGDLDVNQTDESVTEEDEKEQYQNETESVNEKETDDDIINSLNELSDEDDTEADFVNDAELNQLKDSVYKLQNELNINQDKFSRTENKFDFASEVINAKENQKTSNLDSSEIDDLIKKRRFTNICKQFDWNVLADIMNNVVTDIESYSLSKDALLVKLITTDLSRATTITEQNIKRVKGGRKDNKNGNEVVF